MSMQNNERNPHIESINIGALGAGTTSTVVGFFVPKRSRIKAAWLIDTALLAVSTSNYVTATLQDNSGSPVVYATGNSKVGVAALTPLPIALAVGGGLAFDAQPTNADNSSQSGSTGGYDADQATAPETDVPVNTMLNVKVVSTGTQTLTNALLCVEWYPL